MKALLISYYFPPLGGIASIRAMKYVKYLRANGIEPIVLTVNPFFVRYPKDKTLLQELPDGLQFYRCRTLDPNWLLKILYGFKLHRLVEFLRKRILIPDLEVTWQPYVRKKLPTIIKDNPDIKIAFISAGPFSALSAGKILKKDFGIPYVCEFRDEWTNNPERINISYPAASLRRELMWEAEALMNCAGVVYLTGIMRDNFLSRYPFLEQRPGAVIPNGFDESDFSNLAEVGRPVKSKVFRIVYCGSFYDRRQPDMLWDSVLRLSDRKLLDLDKIHFDIYGNNTMRFVLGRHVNNEKIRQIVRLHPFQSHGDSIKRMLEADALLLYITSGKNTESILTGKIFDYIRTGKPILSLVPSNGLAAEIVRKSNTGFVAEPSDQDQTDIVLLKLYELWKDDLLHTIKPNMQYISGFRREKLTLDLANLLKRCANET